MMTDDLRSLRGLVATVVTTGNVLDEFWQAYSEMRVQTTLAGFDNIEWRRFVAPFVERGRDQVVAHALNPKGDGSEAPYDWILQIDADAAPIPSDALMRILHRAYVDVPDADVMGAYCQLKHPPYLPTIDTGTGTWEPILPGRGVLPVIRTGAHFLLTKTPLLMRMGSPWFRTRTLLSPLAAMREVDNFARCQLDGQNPFADAPAWKTLMRKAAEAGPMNDQTVGEDSGFCDRAKAIGGRLYVDTDLVVGHIRKHVITPRDLKDEMDKRDAQAKAFVGVYD